MSKEAWNLFGELSKATHAKGEKFLETPDRGDTVTRYRTDSFQRWFSNISPDYPQMHMQHKMKSLKEYLHEHTIYSTSGDVMNKELVFRILETGIVELVDAFLARPYAFYTESDLHCFLYHTLWNLGLNRACRCKVNGRLVESVLLHKEYPTKGGYRRRQDTESTIEERGARGHFDISVWDQVLAEQRQFRAPRGEGEQRTLAAVELSLNEHHKNFQWHIHWDLLKLKDPKNEVERGIILFFVRDYPYRRTRFPRNGFIITLHEMFGDENKVPIVYVEKLGSEERKGTISRASFHDYPSLEP